MTRYPVIFNLSVVRPTDIYNIVVRPYHYRKENISYVTFTSQFARTYASDAKEIMRKGQTDSIGMNVHMLHCTDKRTETNDK